MEKETKYGIRKLSVGVASVAVGSFVAGADAVHAEETEMPVGQGETTREIPDEVIEETELLSSLQFTEEENTEEVENVSVYSGGGQIC